MLRAVLDPDQDAFGHLLMDLTAGQTVVEVVERDDGCVFTGDPSYYLAPFRSWWPQGAALGVLACPWSRP